MRVGDDINLHGAELSPHHCNDRGVTRRIQKIIDANRGNAAIICRADLQLDVFEDPGSLDIF